MRLFRSLPLAATALLTLVATGCVVSVPTSGPRGANGANRPPIISSFTSSPSSGLTKDQPVTFQLVATDPEGQPLQVTWSATKGTLSSTSGLAVSWRAVDVNNQLDAGLATVTAIVSDGTQTTPATVNIQVLDNGTVTIDGTSTGSGATPSTAPSAAASPTPAPSASPSTAASASPEASPSPSASPSTAAAN